MKNYLSITFAVTAAILLLGLIATGVRLQQSQTTVDRQQVLINKLLEDPSIDAHWIEMQEKMREAAERD